MFFNFLFWTFQEGSLPILLLNYLDLQALLTVSLIHQTISTRRGWVLSIAKWTFHLHLTDFPCESGKAPHSNVYSVN